jgi:hypothetical protein
MMNKLVVSSIALMVCGLVGAMVVEGEAEPLTGDPVTLEGTIACARCTLHVKGQEHCQNVLIVEEDGKETRFFMTKNEVYEEFGSACKGTPKLRVTGKIEEKEGVKWITPSEITPQTEQG